ncbi:ABC transporter substrate-binding protein (plasmid) [Cupriavidus necator]|uniref:ABC transporter substrate-binding protein n=1 Tax=Cupriavidus necator TaxID=106590 RepID=A0A1U9V2F7_CUPNE|nr:tripartite tricarboxylate transporter substrate binding protein [Cupriavidus necator]AQV99144.1 ABC transporter substrate-binding protein [Cupriavidus necator]
MNRMTTGKLVGVLMASIAALCPTFAISAEPYPSRPIRIVVGTAPGGATDITTRLVAQKMSERLGQPIVVENRPGGDTMVATRYVRDQPADGYTILAQSLGFLTLPYTKKEPGYTIKDFSGIGPMTRAPFLMLVGAGGPRSLKEYVAKASAGDLSYGHGGIASAPHIAAESVLRAYGANVLPVPYKGNGAAMTDVMAGRVSMFFDAYISSSGYVKSGKMRALAVTSAQRLAAAPDIPTFKEQGLDYTFSVWLGLLAKSGTPKDVMNRLSDALKYALTDKALVQRFQADGAEPYILSPEAFDERLAAEFSSLEKVAADLKFVKE